MQKFVKLKKKVTNHNHDKDITTSEFNKLTTEKFTARLAQANLVIKKDFDAQLVIFDKKINLNKTIRLLVKKELKKLQAFDSSYFRSKSHFEEDVLKIIYYFSQCEKILRR